MTPDIPDLSVLTFDTACGLWRTHYIGQPRVDLDNIEYWIRFKWVDPHEPENKATPERRLRLLIPRIQLVSNDSIERLIQMLGMWLDSDEMDMVFDYSSSSLLPRDRS